MRPLLTTEEAAQFAGVTAKTLNNWRCLGHGPAFHKIGRLVKYDPADIERWKAARRFHSTSEVA